MIDERIFRKVDCQKNCEGCVGLFVSANGSGLEIKQNEKEYIVRTREGDEARGTCSNYLGCMHDFVISNRNKRRPAEIKPYSI